MVKMTSSKARGAMEPEAYSLERAEKRCHSCKYWYSTSPYFFFADGQTGSPTRPQASHNRRRTLWGTL